MSDYTFTCAGGDVTTAMNLEHRLVFFVGDQEALVFTDDGVTASPDVPIDDAAKAVIDAVMLQWPAPLHRAEVIRELVEKAEGEAKAAREVRAEIDAIPEDGPWQKREREYYCGGKKLARALNISDWLKAQMEGE